MSEAPAAAMQNQTSTGGARANPAPSPRASSVAVIVPAFNEAAAIGPVVAGLLPVCRNVVVVDDGSSDATAALAREAGAVVLRHALNRGQGAALQTGIAWALRRGAEVIVTFDADGQHDPSDIPSMVARITEGRADAVLGSRFLGSAEGMPPARRLLLRAAVLLGARRGPRLTDAHNGLRALSRRAAEGIDLRLDRMAHATEIVDQLLRNGLRIEEAPVVVRYTDYSRRKGQRGLGAVRIVFDYVIGRYVR